MAIDSMFSQKFPFYLLLALSVLIVNKSAFCLPQNAVFVDGKELASISDISQHLQDGSRVYLGPGVFDEGFIINKNNVLLSGEGAHFVDAAIKGKAAIIVSGEGVTIEGIECSQISVNHDNGACIRQEGRDLTLINVYFHNSQQGILTNSLPGFLKIKHSRFEKLGYKGRAHAIYVSTENFSIENSVIIDTKDQGHGVKSRSKVTTISNSVISSGTSNDSRLIDISNGGELRVTDTILHQGKNTVNSQLIGYGLESIGRKRNHLIEVDSAIVIAERVRGNQLLLLPKELNLEKRKFTNSVFVGRFSDETIFSDKSNTAFDDRADASIKEDSLPNIGYLKLVQAGIIK